MASDSGTVSDGADPARTPQPSFSARSGGLLRADRTDSAVRASTQPDDLSERFGVRTATRLVERDAEIAQLQALVGSTSANGYPAGVLVIQGPPGVGRTALLHTACHLAGAGGSRVLRARGCDLEADEPLGLLKQIIAQLHAAGSLAPSVRALLDDAARTPVDAAALHRLFEAVDNALVGHAGTRTVVIAIDDIHWSDQTSVMWLGYLARRADRRPVQIVLTTWPVEPSRAATPLDRLLGDASTRRLNLAPLSSGAVADLVRARLSGHNGLQVDDGLTEACHEATGGNPALLFALLDTLVHARPTPTTAEEVRRIIATEPPADVARSVLRRAHLAGFDAVTALESVHLLGKHATSAAIEATSDVAHDDLPAVLSALRVSGLITAREPYSFQHPLEAASLASVIPPARHREVRRKAAEYLHSAGAQARDIAEHLLFAPDEGNPSTIATLREAAHAATLHGAHHDACRYLKRALAEPPDHDTARELRLELALSEVKVDSPEALERMLEVTADPPPARVVSMGAAGLIAANRAVRARARDLLSMTAAAARDEPVEVRSRIAVTEAMLANPSHGRRLLAQVVGDVETSTHAPTLHRLAIIERANAAAASPGRTHAESVARDVADNLTTADLIDPDRLRSAIALQGVVTLIRIGDLEAARHVLTPALRQLPADRQLAAVIVRLAAHVAQERGQLTRAKSLRERFERLDRVDCTGCHALFASWDADLLSLERSYDRAAVLLEEARLKRDPNEHWMIEPFAIDETIGWLQLWRGDPTGALTAFRRASGLAESRGVDNPAITSWRSGSVFALSQMGERSQAIELAAEEVERAEAFGVHYVTARCKVALAGALPRSERLKVLHSAVEQLTPPGPALIDVRLRIACGQALIGSGDAAGARAVLRVAADTAQRLRAPGLMERSRRSLRAAGARPRRLAMTGPAALTPAERRVASLAAQGLTNTAIAEMLFINVKTVESHLARAFKKLDVSSRTELPDALDPDAAPH